MMFFLLTRNLRASCFISAWPSRRALLLLFRELHPPFPSTFLQKDREGISLCPNMVNFNAHALLAMFLICGEASGITIDQEVDVLPMKVKTAGFLE
jgi:hypothetical protein